MLNRKQNDTQSQKQTLMQTHAQTQTQKAKTKLLQTDERFDAHVERSCKTCINVTNDDDIFKLYQRDIIINTK